MRRVDAAADGEPSTDTIETGFPSIDKLLGGGIRRGDLVIIAGDVGSGKSALALAVAIRASQRGKEIAFLSGEMSTDRVMERALAIEGRARIDDLRLGSMDEATRARVGGAAVRLRERAPSVTELPGGGVEGLEAELRRRHGLDAAIVDPLEALASGDLGLAEELASAVRQLKSLALDLHVALLVTTHLPALARDRRDLRPVLDDLGGLGALKQHADVVLGLYREEMYQPGHGVEGATELIVNKNRNGTTGYADLYFFKHCMRFEDMLDPDR